MNKDLVIVARVASLNDKFICVLQQGIQQFAAFLQVLLFDMRLQKQERAAFFSSLAI
jgi:hypothetical protein